MDFICKSIACFILHLEMCDYQDKLHVLYVKFGYVLSGPWMQGVVKHLLLFGD